MKKKKVKNDFMLKEYDFSGGEKGKYAKKYSGGTNIVVLDPDVAKIFPDQRIVNQTLRMLANILKQRSKLVHS